MHTSETKEFCLGSFLTRDVFIRGIKNNDDKDEHFDIFYGKNYENWNDLRLGCDICNENSVGGLKINYGTLKSQHQKEGEFFLLNDVRIVDEDDENDTEYNMATYWECKDAKHFPYLFSLYQQFDQLRHENPTHYTNIQHCQENPPTYKKFDLEYDLGSVTGTFYEFTHPLSASYEEFISNNSIPQYVSVCGKCHIYLKIFRPDITFVQSHPLKYFWHMFYEMFSPTFEFKNIEDKHYIETYVFVGES